MTAHSAFENKFTFNGSLSTLKLLFWPEYLFYRVADWHSNYVEVGCYFFLLCWSYVSEFETRTLLGRLTLRWFNEQPSSAWAHLTCRKSSAVTLSRVLWGRPEKLRDQNPREQRCEEQSRGELTPKLEHWWTERRACERGEPLVAPRMGICFSAFVSCSLNPLCSQATWDMVSVATVVESLGKVCIYLLFELLKKTVAKNILNQL